jgi:hypothetical protein
MIDRSALVNAFIWDVELTGEDEAGVASWITTHGAPPKPGTVRAHNEKEKWAAPSPTLGASETESASRLIKNMVLGGAGLPEAWFADGDAANRATLAAQGDPTYKMLVSRQRYVRFVFEDIFSWRLQAEIEEGLLPAGTDTTVTVNMPEPNETDSKAIAAALPQLVTALVGAIDAELIDTPNARTLFLSLAGQLGVDLDAEDIEAGIEAEAKEREAEEEELRAEEAKALAAQGLAGPQPPQDAQGAPQKAPTPIGSARRLAAAYEPENDDVDDDELVEGSAEWRAWEKSRGGSRGGSNGEGGLAQYDSHGGAPGTPGGPGAWKTSAMNSRGEDGPGQDYDNVAMGAEVGKVMSSLPVGHKVLADMGRDGSVEGKVTGHSGNGIYVKPFAGGVSGYHPVDRTGDVNVAASEVQVLNY